jgi:hypothetical protein
VSHQDIINDVLNLLNNGTDEEQQRALTEAREQRKASSVQQNGDAGKGSERTVRGGQTDNGRSGERKDNLSENKEITVPLSNSEVDEYGKPLVLAEDGTTTFGTIDAESELTQAPIKLSLGENRKGEDGNNHGYGLLHIEAGHGEQIRNAGFKSVAQFVEDVAKNYTDIREGALIAGNQTYLLEASDEHNNTLFVQLSKDGTYWNVNSAGIFKKKYSRRKTKVYSVPALGVDSNTETNEVNSSRTKGVTAPAGNSSYTSTAKVDKVSEEADKKQENVSDSHDTTIQDQVDAAAKEVNTEPTEAQKEAGNYKKGHIKLDGYDQTILCLMKSVRLSASYMTD